MSDSGFSFSFNLGNSEAPATVPGLIAIHPFEVHPLDGQRCLLVSQRTGQFHPVANNLVGALQGLFMFRSVEDHAAQLEQQLGGQWPRKALVELLQTLLTGGLMSHSDSICEQVNRQQGNGATAASRVFIMSCDRPAAVARLLESLFANADLQLHEGIFLLDDSRNPDAAAQNRELLAAYRSQSPVPLHYIGQAEKTHYLEQLRQAVPDSPASVAFLFDRETWPGLATYGMSRNWALLLSAGRRCIILDDDVLCEAYYPPYTLPQLRLSNSNIVEIFPDEEAWRADCRATGFDPLAGHLKHLGQSLSSCVRDYNPAGLSTAEFENMLEADSIALSGDSRLLISECGSLGNPGCPLHALLLNSNPTATERMIARDPELNHAFAKRQLRSIQQSVKIDHRANISQITGLDNTEILPPYFPALRGEDGVFGWLVNKIYPTSRVITHNWGVPHLPMDARPGTYREEALIPQVHIGSLCDLLDRSLSFTGDASPDERRLFLASMLREMAARPVSELVSSARREGARQAAAVHARAQERLPYFSGRQPAMEAYLRYAAEQSAQWLANPPPLAAQYGMSPESSDSALVSAISDGLAGFADALEAWPDIRAAAETLTPPG